ncbi:MAG: heavy metal translocating P-type ATPase [Candidatus Fimisoma sp.]|nr:heavy metal translocating P-type ATPase [Candidatus Fimisoma sp.]
MKKRTTRIITGAVIFAAALFVPDDPWWIRLALFLAAYVAVGYKVIWKAVRGVVNGQVLDENFLMAVASIGAFFVGEYPEAVAVMLFYQIGEMFEDYAVGKSRKSITGLMDIRPDSANLKTESGIVTVSPSEVRPGDLIIVRPGEKVPLDGVVIEGISSLNTSALTGESLPREIGQGDEILSGCVNINGLLTVKVTKDFGESTVSKILDLVENSAAKKAKTENFITRFAAVYTPLVVGAAVILAVLPPLLIDGALWADWIYRALNFLVVSCPCALVISVPLSFFGGIGGASKIGVLVKGSNYLEAISKAEYMVMDKTGTLTQGVFHVEDIFAEDEYEKGEILRYAAMAESYSSHPISQSLQAAYGKEIDKSQISDVEEAAGRGVIAMVEGRRVAAGNRRLMTEEAGYDGPLPQHRGGTQVYVSVDGKYAGRILLADKIKEDSASAIKMLGDLGIKTVMLTGDSREAGEKAATELGIHQVYTGLLPADKVDIVENLLKEKHEKGKVVFVGDGINDAPVLARADIGVAMGGLGSDAAIEAADMVIMDDKPSKLASIIKISKKTMTVVYENIVFALGVKAAVLILSALGIVGLWAAVFADVGVSMIAVLNAMRCLNIKFAVQP